MSESKYILSIDQGTTSSRTIIFDQEQRVVAIAQQEFEQHFPNAGWVEHCPEEIWETQYNTIRDAMAKAGCNAKDIAAIGITNQRETLVAWNKSTGESIGRAIVWQDKRTAHWCQSVKEEEGKDEWIRGKTGLVMDPYFSASKMKWLLDNVPEVRNQADTSNLCFGTIDSWLIWKLTNGELHLTDASNASRTLLYNIHDNQWDDELLSFFGVKEECLPKVVSSSGILGSCSIEELKDIPIAGVAGDQQAALFGQKCFETGEAKNTYGTGCFMLMNTGQKVKTSERGLLSTVAWQIDGKTIYALEGSVFIGGAVIHWLRDTLGIIQDAAQTEEIATRLSDNDGVYFVPAFSGLGAPYWDIQALGNISGLTRGTGKEHIVRAALESIAYQSHDLYKTMSEEVAVQSKFLSVDGGATKNNWLMQFQSDLLNVSVKRPEQIESTALGAALLAGLAVGYYRWDRLKLEEKNATIYEPEMSAEKRQHLLNGWNKAIERCRL